MNREEIIINNFNLIYKSLQECGLYDKRDDYIDIGMIGLVKGANTYDPESGYAVSTYLMTCIKNELKQQVRKENCFIRRSNHNTISLNEEVYNKNTDECIYLLDIIPSNINVEEENVRKEEFEELKTAISELKEIEQIVLKYYFGLENYEETNQKDIAAILDISQTQVCRIIKRSIKKLKLILTSSDSEKRYKL